MNIIFFNKLLCKNDLLKARINVICSEGIISGKKTSDSILLGGVCIACNTADLL